MKRVLDNPARRFKVKIMKTFVPPGGATGRWAGPGDKRQKLMLDKPFQPQPGQTQNRARLQTLQLTYC